MNGGRKRVLVNTSATADGGKPRHPVLVSTSDGSNCLFGNHFRYGGGRKSMIAIDAPLNESGAVKIRNNYFPF
jgi:hypothetical protein